MLYIKREKLIKALNQVPEDELSIEDIQLLLDVFGDQYYAEGCNMVLSEEGINVETGVIYKLTQD